MSGDLQKEIERRIFCLIMGLNETTYLKKLTHFDKMQEIILYQNLRQSEFMLAIANRIDKNAMHDAKDMKYLADAIRQDIDRITMELSEFASIENKKNSEKLRLFSSRQSLHQSKLMLDVIKHMNNNAMPE